MDILQQNRLLGYFSAAIEENKEFIQGFTQDLHRAEEHPLPKEGFVGMTVQGISFSDRQEAGEAMLTAYRRMENGKN